jgi:hypothetical protein
MAIDLFAYLTPIRLRRPVDFGRVGKSVEFHRWHNRRDIHGWMNELYRSKGGLQKDWLPSQVELTFADLDRLAGDLPQMAILKLIGSPDIVYTGDQFDDRLFLEKARAALRAGLSVYYDAWS